MSGTRIMPISFSQAYREAMASVDKNITVIDTLSLSHPVFPQVYRVAICEHDITLGGSLYYGKQVDFSFPEMMADSNPSMSIRIGNVGNQVVSWFDKTVESLEPVLLTVSSWVLGSNSPQAGIDNPLEVINFSLKGSSLEISASYPDLVNLKVPRVKYTTKEFGGLRG